MIDPCGSIRPTAHAVPLRQSAFRRSPVLVRRLGIGDGRSDLCPQAADRTGASPHTPAAAPDAGAGTADPAATARRRAGSRPAGTRADADSLARLEGYLRPHLSRDSERSAAGACGRRGLLFAGRLVSGDRRGGFGLRAVCRCRHHRQASFDRRGHRARRRARYAGRGDRAHRGQERRQAHLRFSPGARHRAVERQCRHEGDLRRAQHHL